jgi:hypothetical protein
MTSCVVFKSVLMQCCYEMRVLILSVIMECCYDKCLWFSVAKLNAIMLSFVVVIVIMMERGILKGEVSLYR